MRTGFNKTIFAICLFAVTATAYAMPGTIIAAAVFELTVGTFAFAATAFAINLVASAIISKIFAPSNTLSGLSGESPNPGNRQQVAPATDNKLPIVYGQAWLGGTVVDMSITSDNQNIYFVLAICEVTNNGADTISFNQVFYGGKQVNFQSDGYTVASLIDTSTGLVSTDVAGKIAIYLYKNGSNQPANSSLSAISVMQQSGLTYQWNNTKLMSNCAFAIVKLTYNSNAGITGLQQTKFQITNSRYQPGDCFRDYLTNTVYGAAIPLAQIDTTSLTDLNTYSAQVVPYTVYSGGTATQTRYRFDGVLDPTRTIMQNLQDMASSCNCLIKYNEITGLWGVIVQKPTYTVAMALNDSNIISAIQISPMDIAATYNIIEVKFPDASNQDAFSSATFDLAQIKPALMFPNEPVNKQSITLPLVNNDVRAQYIANQMLEAAREDLQVQCDINFTGLQLEAGDVVTITNANYGWTNKLFRINKVVDQFTDGGTVISKLTLTEFNPTVFDDKNVTQFSPSPNTGIGSPTFFGTLYAPSIGSQYPSDIIPFFLVQVTTSSSGIVQYAEVWYSAYQNPTSAQLIFAGTTEIQSSGTPYTPNSLMPLVQIANLPAGDWYFFCRMVNSIGTSNFSTASAKLTWRPTTFQYASQYLAVAYGTSLTGSGFSLNPRGKTHFGLRNQDTITVSTTPSDYTWYLSDPNFGTEIYLCYTNRGSRRFSFDTGFADYAAGSGAFVPTQTSLFDPRVWSALPDGTNIINLDHSTGQVLETGTTTVGTGEIEVVNNPDGKVIASLKQFLDFGPGVYQYTGTASTLTIDIYGRVVGFVAPDEFYYTAAQFNATAGQTVFSVTRASSYIQGQCLVFKNGCLLDTTEYTDTGGSTGTVTLGTAAALNDRITIVSFRSVSTNTITTTGASGTGSVATLTFGARPSAPFNVGDTITVSGVTPTGYNGDYVVTACTTTSVSYASTTTGAQTVAGSVAYKNNTYRTFTRNKTTLTNASAYTASGFTLTSGYELLFLNGTVVNEQDYDISGQTITNFPSVASGLLTIVQWQPNNLGTPTGNAVNVVQYTTIGQTSYPFSYQAAAFNLYSNGVLQVQGTDYTTGTGNYVLSVAPDTVITVMVQQTFSRTGAV